MPAELPFTFAVTRTRRNQMRVGVIGCGAVSDRYLTTLSRIPGVETLACADAIEDNARRTAATHGIRNAGSVANLLRDQNIDLVVNLTPPAVHGQIGLAALTAGKHLYSEKPLAADYAAARELVDLGAERRLLVGSAPDTFLGSAHQIARAAIAAGAIGTPVASSAMFLDPGYEHSRPNCRKYYGGAGSGPMFSPGLYFVSSLVSLFGPIAQVFGVGRRTHPTRVISVGPEVGRVVPVSADTHVAALVEFASGHLATLVASFDVAHSRSGIEVYGTGGTLRLPDPRAYGGPVSIQRSGNDAWTSVDVASTANDYYGVGLADMILCARTEEPRHRTSAEFSIHVLEATTALLESLGGDQKIAVVSRCEPPRPLTHDLLSP
jgi:predicted dehydrogenase